MTTRVCVFAGAAVAAVALLSPVVVEGELYCRGYRYLYCIAEK